MFHICEYEHISVDRSGRFGVYGCRLGSAGFLAERGHDPRHRHDSHHRVETPEPLEKVEMRQHVERVETPEAAETPETLQLEQGGSSN